MIGLPRRFHPSPIGGAIARQQMQDEIALIRGIVDHAVRQRDQLPQEPIAHRVQSIGAIHRPHRNRLTLDVARCVPERFASQVYLVKQVDHPALPCFRDRIQKATAIGCDHRPDPLDRLLEPTNRAQQIPLHLPSMG